MFHLLVILIALSTNDYGVNAVILDASMLARLGYNNQSSQINIAGSDITDIDANAFKGYTKVTYFRIQSSGLIKIDLGVLEDSVNLQTILFFNNPSFTQITNPRKIVFPFVERFAINDCPMSYWDSNCINALPNVTTLEIYSELKSRNQLSPIKPNQLSPLKKLHMLYIKTKNQTSLTKDHFAGLGSVDWLSFKDSDIKTVEVHTLLALPNIRNVDLSYNDITAFEYLQIPEKLNGLGLKGNKMNYFMLSRTMGYLGSLSIAGNLFRSFKSMDFTFLANLTYLDLSNNPHAYPNEIAGHMKPLVNLNTIVLSNLSILSIDSNFFKQNTKLINIDLSKNKISSISYDAFINLKGLTNLDLSNNQIGVLDNRTFSGLDILRNLYLQSNRLAKISSRTFYNLKTLYNLDLSNNLISEIESSAFSGSYSYPIGNLYLSYNPISKIWPRAFENFKTYSIMMKYCQITELDNLTFTGLEVIELHLSFNNISKISSGSFNNASVRSLGLSYNMISTIEVGSFNGSTNIQTIDLGNNKLSTIESGVFNGLTSLQNIYLNNNNLTQLDNSTFVGCNNLKGIYLNNNPNLQKSNLQSLCPIDAVNCNVYF